MHLSTSALSNASASLHYPMPPCHYSNQQTTYGMMAGTYAQLTQLREVLLFWAHVLSRIINTHRNTVCVCVSSTGNALCQHLSDPHPADMQCPSCQHGQRSQFTARYNLNLSCTNIQTLDMSHSCRAVANTTASRAGFKNSESVRINHLGRINRIKIVSLPVTITAARVVQFCLFLLIVLPSSVCSNK